MSSLPPFSITYDYRCPFARHAHEHVIAALRAGADWNVTFRPFSLNQAHVLEDGLDVWDDPAAGPALLAGLVSLVVRDDYPDKFLDAHHALFSVRHVNHLELRDPAVIADAIASVDLDDAAVLKAAGTPELLKKFRAEHEASVNEHKVFGVPTFIVGDAAVFVRLQTMPQSAESAVQTVERIVNMTIEWPDLNEFKWTSIRR